MAAAVAVDAMAPVPQLIQPGAAHVPQSEQAEP